MLPRAGSHGFPLPISNWRIGEKIGAGAYGEVHKAINADTGSIFAVKTLRIDGVSATSVDQEIELLTTLSHPHVVRYLGCELQPEKVCIFMEYLAGGSIYDIIKTYGPPDVRCIPTPPR